MGEYYFYERIKMLSRERGKSISQVERELRYSSESLSDYKISPPSVLRLFELAEYFDVTIAYLVGKTEHSKEIKGGETKIMDDKSLLKVKSAWEELEKEPTIWEHLEIKNKAFYFKTKEGLVFLSSFKNEDLPASPYSLTFLGKVLTKLSPFANIMSRRPGTEEVTFFTLLNSPQSGAFGKLFDKKMLKVAAPPLVWRRNQIREEIRENIKACVKKNQSFFFLDIGSGGGFDSLEIERLIHRINELTDLSFNKPYESLNIDIDTKWMNNNRILSEKLFGVKHRITRENISVFEFLKECPSTEIKPYDHLIVSCNGFAEFLSDIELLRLYKGIYDLAQGFEGHVHIILPFANKNKKQENLGNKIGFQFKAQSKESFITMIKEIFIEYQVNYNEKYSHIVLVVDKNK